jgi:hypothetical protein
MRHRGESSEDRDRRDQCNAFRDERTPRRFRSFRCRLLWDLFHRVVCGDVRFAPGQNDFLRALAEQTITPSSRGTAQLIIFRADESRIALPMDRIHPTCLVRPSFRGITNRIVINKSCTRLNSATSVGLPHRSFYCSVLVEVETVSFIVSMAMARQT